jgi:hypothetical protein
LIDGAFFVYAYGSLKHILSFLTQAGIFS